MEKKTYRVAKEDNDARFDRWCQRILGKAPNSIYLKAMRKGLLRIDGKKAEGNTRVTTGQTIEVRGHVIDPYKTHTAKPTKAMDVTLDMAREAQSWVLYRDKDIMVINKPAGLAVQGGSGITKHLDGLLPCLQFDAKDIPRLVHRLDKDTSGVLLLARHVAAATELQRAFARKTIKKTYLAITVGVPQPYEGEIESKLEKRVAGEGSYEQVRSVEEDEGKHAVTRYRTIEHMAKKIALVELEPITGRTHQLRVHMAEMDCPILGDGKYGGKDAHLTGSVKVSAKLHLQAWRIVLPPMFGKEERDFEAPIAPHIKKSLDALGLTINPQQ